METRLKALAATARSVPGEEPRAATVLDAFGEKIAPKIALGPTAMAILQAFANIDVTADRMARVLQGNSYFEVLFQRVVESVSKREPQPSTEAAIILMGIQNSRNLIVANQILRTVKGGYPEWTKEGKLKVLSSDIVKLGLKTEEALVSRKDPHSDMGFVAGVVLDILAQLALEHSEEKKRVAALIDAVHDHGMKAAAFGAVLVRGLPAFPYPKFVVPACLLHDVGKVVLAILDRRYPAFMDEMQKKDVPRALRFQLERDLFGVDHAVLGSMVLRAFPPLRPAAAAVMLHHSPFWGGEPDEMDAQGAGAQARTALRGTRQLGVLLSLASNMATKPKKIDNPADPAVALWKGNELRDFDFPADIIVQASQSGI
jgi:hypothetical protein